MVDEKIKWVYSIDCPMKIDLINGTPQSSMLHFTYTFQAFYIHNKLSYSTQPDFKSWFANVNHCD